MATETQKHIVIGEEGGYTVLSGDPQRSIGGAETRLKQGGRRGYLAILTGDARKGGTITMVQPLNDPEVPFDEVQARFALRNRGRSPTNNTLFKR